MDDTKTFQNIEKKLTAILALLVEEREHKTYTKDLNKIEVVLNNLGFSSSEIANIIQKNQVAVIKSLQRAKK